MIQFIRQHGEVILEVLGVMAIIAVILIMYKAGVFNGVFEGLIETFNEKAQSKIWME